MSSEIKEIRKITNAQELAWLGVFKIIRSQVYKDQRKDGEEYDMTYTIIQTSSKALFRIPSLKRITAFHYLNFLTSLGYSKGKFFRLIENPAVGTGWSLDEVTTEEEQF